MVKSKAKSGKGLRPRRCAWKKCRKWFIPKVGKQRYHTQRCAQRDRQYKWYHAMRAAMKSMAKMAKMAKMGDGSSAGGSK